MKAVIIHEFGGREKLILTEVPPLKPGEGEVLIRIKASGVNPVDWKIREGLRKDRLNHQFPIILGWEMAGIVEELGYAARRFKVEDKVYGLCRRPIVQKGTYAEYIAIPESYITFMPRNLSFEKAAAVPLSGLTAYQCLFDRARLKRGETVLIVGASGGVGGFAVQFVKAIQAKVIAVASSRHQTYLKRLGADHFLDYTKGDFRLAVKALRPKGVSVVLAAVGGESLLQSYDCVKKGGRLVTIVEPGDQDMASHKKIKLFYHFVEPNSRQLDHIRDWIEEKKVKIHLSGIFPLEQARRAQELIETGHTQGKIVLKGPP